VSLNHFCTEDVNAESDDLVAQADRFFTPFRYTIGPAWLVYWYNCSKEPLFLSNILSVSEV
jgi:hypothetical protein